MSFIFEGLDKISREDKIYLEIYFEIYWEVIMGKSLTIQDSDDKKIDQLKEYFQTASKIAVVRMALELLDQERLRQERSKQWMRAVKAVKKSSADTNKKFSKSSTVGKKVS